MTTQASPLAIWLLAIRPKTLFASLAPVLLSWGLVINAYGLGAFSISLALFTLGAALSVQILSNLVNDYEDFRRGADANRIGPVRVMQANLVNEKQMKMAIGVTTGLTFFFGMLLTLRGGWPIVLLTLSSIICAYLYTAGPFPLGYHGLGEIFAFVFFGPVATGASYYLQTLELPKSILLIGMIPGCFSAGLLLINNLRDEHGDRSVGKKTIVVRFGGLFGKALYFALILSASTLWIYFSLSKKNYYLLLGLAFLILLIPVVKILRSSIGPHYNRALVRTSLAMLVFSIIASSVLIFFHG